MLVSTSRTRRRGLSFTARATLVAAVVLAAACLLLLAERQSVLQSRLDRLHAAGVPSTWADAIPLVPKRDNAAPIYQQAIAHLSLSGTTRYVGRFIDDDNPQSRQSLLPMVREVLSRNRRALELVRAGTKKPDCRFPLHPDLLPWGIPESVDAHRLYVCGRLLLGEALVRLSEGDAEQAIESCRCAIRYAGHLRSSRTFTQLWMSHEIQNAAFDALAQVLAAADIDPAACRALFDEVGALDLPRAYRETLAANLGTTLTLFDSFQSHPGEAKETLRSATHQPQRSWLIAFYAIPITRLLRIYDEIASIDLIERNLALTDQPYRSADYRPLHATMSATPWYLPVARNLIPSYSRSHRTRDWAIAHRNAMQIVLALEAYHTTRGGYPNSLDALQSYPGWRLPNDPFSGKPFVYRRQGDGFVLYSFGGDLDDDGGWPAEVPHRGDGDVVWELAK